MLFRSPDGTTRRVTAAWVAGCDGSRSPVRELSGIKFPGAPYEHTFFVADTEATGSMKAGELNVYLWKDGFHLFFPMRGKDGWRVIGILPKNLRQRDDLTFEEVVPAIQQEAGTNLSFKACHWFSTYRISHRAAEHFRDRRCFLLGDASRNCRSCVLPRQEDRGGSVHPRRTAEYGEDQDVLCAQADRRADRRQGSHTGAYLMPVSAMNLCCKSTT